MSDLHQLPLTGHDLPVIPRAKLRVYKDGPYWYWEHACSYRPPSTPSTSYPFSQHSRAVHWGLRHMEGCL